MPSIIKTVTLAVGETFTLPPNSKIIYVSDSTSLTSTCEDIPEDTELLCYRLAWSSNRDQSDSPNLETQTVSVDSIYVNGIQYTLSVADETNAAAVASAIETAVGTGVLTDLTGYDPGSTSDRYLRRVDFKAPETIGKTVEMKLIGTGFEGDLYIKAVEIECP
jgi:hypothetical protein